jgi:hypothetical protein
MVYLVFDSVRAHHETRGDQVGEVKGLWNSDVIVDDIQLPVCTQFSSPACLPHSSRGY